MPGGDGHAVVIGASIAGMLAASVLRETFGQVTVLDRDVLPEEAQHRPGVPQGRHAHGLHGRGAAALDELLPGLGDEMTAAGAVVADAQADIRFYLEGRPMRQAPSDLRGVNLTRRLLEWLIRRRVTALPGVRITGSTTVDGLVAADGRVTGVLARDRGSGQPETLSADLVVDASGRGSRAPVWLAELGYPAPAVSRVRTDVVYVTRYYRFDQSLLSGCAGAVITPSARLPRLGGVFPQEGGQFVVTLAGMVGESPPIDDAGMLAFARSLPGPECADVIGSGVPLGEAARMRFPASVRRHYEKLGRHPEGFVAIGDAICSFNPIYGQGITVAALESLALGRVLSAGRGRGLARRWYRAASATVNEAWTLSVGGDLRFPGVEGSRPPGTALVNAYLSRFYAAATVDTALGAAFLRVANMLDPPARLLAPRNVARVLRSAPRARPRA